MKALAHKHLRLLAFALVLLSTVPGCGIVWYRRVSITVRDELTNAPIPDATVMVDCFPEPFEWNPGKVFSMQKGCTDEHGIWTVNMATAGTNAIGVDSDGYDYKGLVVGKEVFRAGELEVRLTPSASEFTTSRAANLSSGHDSESTSTPDS